MIGENEILLNEPALCVAVQHYFDSVVFKDGRSPKVTGVSVEKEDGRGYGNKPTSFRIKTSDPSNNVWVPTIDLQGKAPA